MWVITTRFTPASLGVLPGLRRGQVPAHARPLGPGSVASMINRSASRATSMISLAGPGVGAVGDLPLPSRADRRWRTSR